MMIDVYEKDLTEGTTDYLRSFNSMRHAIEYILLCYKLDELIGRLGKFYYTAKDEDEK